MVDDGVSASKSEDIGRAAGPGRRSARRGTLIVLQPLIRKLETLTRLTDEETRALLDVQGEIRRFGSREPIVREDDMAGGVNVILEGYAFRSKTMLDGRRQITAYFIPGDLSDSNPLLRARRDYSVYTLTSALVATVQLDGLLSLISQYPGIERALRWAAVAQAAIAREWLVSLGQRTALERLAHLLCEIYHRHQVVGLTNGNSCEFPVTQADLADTLGLSTVHVNRTLQDLRRDGLITFKGRTLAIHDCATLEQMSVFDPAYLRPGGAGEMHHAAE
jgi:CRP-like cAMP-binding protein